MNVAIGVWVLLAGGWVLPSDDQSSIPPRAGVLNVGEAPDSGGRLTRVVSLPEAQPVITQPSTVGRSRGTGQAMPGLGAAPRRQSLGLSAMRFMPPVPTEGALATGYFPPVPTENVANPMMPGVPTQVFRGNPQRPGMGAPANMFGRNGAGGGRSMGPPMTSFTQLESRNTGGGLGPMGTGFSANTGAPAEKAFSRFQQAPSVSAYQNLFRNDNAGGTIDNYTTLVQPQLQQQQQQQQLQQIGTDVSGLQNQVAPLLPPPSSQNQPLSPIPQYNANPPGTGTGSYSGGNGQ